MQWENKKIHVTCFIVIFALLQWSGSEPTTSLTCACTPYPNIRTASTMINITHQNGTFVIKDKPILTHHNPPKSIDYLRILSWCTFCGFGQMYNDMYPSLLYHPEYFHCPKHPLGSTYSSLPPRP